jgi:hypothetical protein
MQTQTVINIPNNQLKTSSNYHEEEVVIKNCDNLKFLETISSGSIVYQTHTSIASTRDQAQQQSNILMNGGYTSYAKHLSYEISPDQLWYMIVDTIATVVNLKPKSYSHLFDPTWIEGSKKVVKVINNDQTLNGEWLTSIDKFENKLKEFMPLETITAFTPYFSTSSQYTYLTNLLCLMDSGSTFYSYVVSTRCGVQNVRLTGTKEDYELIQNLLVWVEFNLGHDLQLYVDRLRPVLDSIIKTFDDGIDDKFWGDIIKIGNLHGSGTPSFDGWLGYFTGYSNFKNRDNQIEKEIKTAQEYKNWSTGCIPSHITSVPFIWDYYGTEIPMKFLGGPIGLKHENGFLIPEFGIAVAKMES